MTVKDDLIGTKALIDTPEKWSVYGSMDIALQSISGGNYDRRRAVQKALGNIHGRMRYHDEVIKLFDRAIAASEPSHV